MQKLIYLLGIMATIACIACSSDNSKPEPETIAAHEGGTYALPADVLATAKPLIGGSLYSEPDFESVSLMHFDTAQLIQLLDTSNVMFFKARIYRNKENYTGYISKAIIPEQL
ncbi:hypothetical protein [Pontibacter burrus]|nr:hypothetical protein [Pontibacter burrus]